MTVRKSTWIDQLQVRIRSVDERPDRPAGETMFVVKDIFTTVDGSWDPEDKLGSLPAWAREAYLRPWGAPDYFDDAGGDHNLFAMVLGLDGRPLKGKGVIFWSDGFQKLGDPAYQGYVLRETKPGSGWANIVVYNGYYPDQGQVGAWCWCPFGVAAEVVQGGGLPYKRHVSMFAVWQEVRRTVVSQYPTGLDGVRQRAWDEVGVNYNPEAAFSRYAREHGLGIPLTNEFDIHGYRAQGFIGGIVYAPVGQWEQIAHLAW